MPALNCELARRELSAYVERDLAENDRQALEVHLLTCKICQDELDYIRMLVGALRCMPALEPPSTFASRVVQRWSIEQNEALAPGIIPDVAPALTTAVPTVAAVAVAQPAPPAPQPVSVLPPTVAIAPFGRAAAPKAWGPPPPRAAGGRPQSRANLGLAVAMFALIFFVGLATGKSYFNKDVQQASLIPTSDKIRQAFDLRLDSPATANTVPTPPTITQGDDGSDAPSECEGHPNQWNPTTLHMRLNEPLCDEIRAAEIAVWVPQNVRVVFNNDEYSSGQLVLIKAPINNNGEWQGDMRWTAVRSGRFNAWIETRCRGLYLHRTVVFNVAP